MNKVIKFTFLGLLGIFLLLFVSYENGYYERINGEKALMTEEMIMKYEEDLANGIDVTKEDYSIKKNDYANLYTRTSLKVSNKVEDTIDSVIKFFFRKLNDMVGE